MNLKNKLPVRKRLTRDERRQQTVTFLREAALGEFASCGVAGTSAERIAEAAGFTRGAFYANFENKQALLLDLVREKISTELQAWSELLKSPCELEDLLEVLNKRTLEFDPNGVWSLIAMDAYLYAQRDAAFAAQYRQYHDQMCANLTHVLEGLFLRAGKTPPLAVDELAEALWVLHRNSRLPASDVADSRPKPFSADMMILMLRGLIAVAPAIEESAPKRLPRKTPRTPKT